MKIVIVHHHKFDNSDDDLLHNVFTLIKSIHSKIIQIMATQAELAQAVNQISTQVGKIKDETSGLQQKITDLENAVGNQDNVSPELQAAVDALKAQVQVVDDLVADVPAPPPVEGEQPQ